MAREDNNILPVRDLLGGLEQSLEESINVSDIMAFEKEQPSRADQIAVEMASRTGEPAAGKFGRDTLFPGINDPILKGTSSSKTLGSQPIFVESGGFIPFDIAQQREQAKQKAATVRAQQLQSFTVGNPPELDNPRFQQKFNEDFFSTANNFIDEAKTQFGENWDVALKSEETDIGRRFRQSMANFDTISKHGNEIFSRVAEIEKGDRDGTLFVDEETRQLAQEVKTRTGRFKSGDVGDILEPANLLEASVSLNKLLKDQNIISGIKQPTISPQARTFADKGDFTLMITESLKTIEPQARELARQLKEEQFQDVDFYTEDRIFSRIMASWGDQNIRKEKVIKKPTARIDKFVPTDVQVRTDPKSFRFGEINIPSSKSAPIGSEVGPINVSGAIVFNPGTGALIEEDIENIQPVEFAELDVAGKDAGDIFGRDVTGISKEVLKAIESGKLQVLIGEITVDRPASTELKVVDKKAVETKTPAGKVQENVYILVSGQEERFSSEKDLGVFFDEFRKVETTKPKKEEVQEVQTSAPQEGDEQPVQGGTAIFRNGQWELKT